MCAVSMIGDFYKDKWTPQPWFPQYVPTVTVPAVSKDEFEALKKEVQEMKELLIRAKKYDEETGQKNCEMDEKVAILKKVAEMVGISLDNVFK